MRTLYYDLPIFIALSSGKPSSVVDFFFLNDFKSLSSVSMLSKKSSARDFFGWSIIGAGLESLFFILISSSFCLVVESIIDLLKLYQLLCLFNPSTSFLIL